MNWGMKIVLGLGLFIVFIVGLGIYMVSSDTDSLIDEDYYEKGLTYDSVYESKQNLVNDDAAPAIKVQNDTLIIIFKSQGNRGALILKRPSDGRLDKKIPFFTETDVFKMPVSTLSKGNWNLETSWEHDKKTYIANQALYIQ